jgi:hypothetical protein
MPVTAAAHAAAGALTGPVGTRKGCAV